MRKKLPAILGFLSKIYPTLAAKIALSLFATPVRTPRPISESLWHESAKKYFLKKGIAAFEWGDPTDPLVLLIHGWNGRGTQLASFTQSLVQNKFRVVALDGPGHGNSAGKKTNPSHYAQFIIEAQQELLLESSTDTSHAIIAHSFGGGCTVLAATRGLKTKGFVLIASPAFYDRVVHFFAQTMKLRKKSEDLFFKMVTDLAGISPVDLNIGRLGATLNLPVLIVHDEEDTAVDFLSAKAIRDTWPGSQLLSTTGLGHRRILKNPYVIESVTKFILTLRS